jgi:hypothetical protein
MSNRTRGGRPAGLGYVVDDIRKEASHLTVSQYEAAKLIMAYMAGGWGSSEGLVGQIGTKVDCSTVARLYPPSGGGHLDERTAQQLRGLRQHEIELISRIAFGRGRCLEEYGMVNSGYKTNKTARAFAIGRVTALLESVAELAQLKPTMQTQS